MASGAASSVSGSRLVFNGLSFFLVQRLPTRTNLIGDIEMNGGRVVRQEAQADFVIADHARRDAPTGSHSYQFIELAIREGTLPLKANYASHRTVTTPAKATRTPFTAADDRLLWEWVESEKAAGSAVKGLEIYKRLAIQNPRHTYQAWRDRYLKKLMTAERTPTIDREGLAVAIDQDLDAQRQTVQRHEDQNLLESHTVETQDIYNAETQRLDLGMPLPPSDSDDEPEQRDVRHGRGWAEQQRALTPLPQGVGGEHQTCLDKPVISDRQESSIDVKSNVQDQGELLDSWISTMIVREWSERSCIRALKCTSMRLDLAELVLVTERSGHSLPDNIPGIWSEAEDSVLESGDATALMHLEAKHGWQECESRLKYLDDWRET